VTTYQFIWHNLQRGLIFQYIKKAEKNLEKLNNFWFAAQDLNKIPVEKEIQDDPEKEGKKNKRCQNRQQPTTRNNL